MARSNWDACAEEIRRHEGGYANDPKDPGGETNFGISKRSYPHLNIKDLTWPLAKGIYRRDFWNPISGDELAAGIDLATLDPAVNSGRAQGVKWMQRALGLPAASVDGWVGPETIEAARKHRDPVAVVKKACALRMSMLGGLGTWKHYGKGWSNRIARVEAVSIAMAGASPARIERETKHAKAKEEGQATGGITAGAGAGGNEVAQNTVGLDLPVAADVAVIAFFVVVAVLLFLKSRHNRNRAEALIRVAKERLGKT